jgi:hypothetical protein
MATSPLLIDHPLVAQENNVLATVRETWQSLKPGRPGRALLALIGEDLWVAWLVAFATLLQICMIGWDQPSAFSWENDGVAPRDLFNGVFRNLSPGNGHRYPLFHNLILLVLCLPVLLACVLAGPWSITEVIARVNSVTAMTCISLLTKAVHVLMGGVLVLVLARITRRLFDQVAGRGAALCAVTSLTISFYARTSNLDVPYMFWTVLAIDRLLSVLTRGDLRDYTLLGVFAAASVATKDQAYASYVLTLPLFLGLPLVGRSYAAAGEAHLARLGRGLLAGVGAYLVLAGVLFNPTGFITRLRLLTGTNSQDWRQYERSLRGVALNLQDLWTAQTQFFWHWGIVLLCWAGVLMLPFGRPGAGLHGRVARSIPLLAALSSVLAFTLPVARCEHRFVLPLGIWLCVYGGAMLSALIARRRWSLPLLAACALSFGLSALQCGALAFTQWGDARFAVERELAKLAPGSVVETHGFLVYQPRFAAPSSAPYRAQRVGPEPANKRPRIAALQELQGSFAAVTERRPDVLLVNEGSALRYFARTFRPGEAPSAQWLAAQEDNDAKRYVQSAVSATLAGYRLAQVFEPTLPSWLRALGAQPMSIHDHTTGGRIWMLVRESVSAAVQVRGSSPR